MTRCVRLRGAGPVGAACERQPESPASVDAADGVPIRYEVHGSGKPALVFVHGWSCDRTYWNAQVPYFSQRYRVVTIDLAGHGESGLGREVWGMKAFGQDVTAVVEKLGLEQTVLVGHSMGAPVVVEAARLLAGRVKVIVGADTFHDVSQRYFPHFTEMRLGPLIADFKVGASNFVRTMFVPSSDSTLVSHIVDDMSAAPPTIAIGSLEGYINWLKNEQGVALNQLRVPVHLINSDRRRTNLAAGQGSTASFDATLMSGVGHFVAMEDPERFNRLLRETVEGLQSNSIGGNARSALTQRAGWTPASQTQRYSAKQLGRVTAYSAIRSDTQTNSGKLSQTR